MAERGGERGKFGGGFGRSGRGDRGGRRGGRRGLRQEEEKWVPVTKLGRLVKENKFSKIEEIYLQSLPVKEDQIVETLVPGLKDEVTKITPVQKQTRAGQRTRFKAFVVGGAIILAKLSWDAIIIIIYSRPSASKKQVQQKVDSLKKSLLEKTCDLLRNFPEYMDVVVSVARKTDGRHWADLFSAAGRSTDLKNILGCISW